MDEKSGRKTLVSKAKSKTSWSWSDKLAIALACLAAILDLILHWVEKTPVLAAITVVAMVSLIVFPVIIFPHWKLRIPVLIVACALIGLFGWQIWPRKEAALSFTSTMEKAQQSSVLSKPVENPYQHTAAPTTSRQLRTPSVAKQQDCQSGSICNQDSLVDAPQTVIDRSQSAVRITNNGGEISGIAVNGAAVVGPNTSERAQSLVHLKSAGSAIRDVPIQDAKLCNFPTWDDYLDCIVTDPSWAEGWAKMYHNATKKRLYELKYPADVANRCLEEIDDANKLLISHETNELNTAAYLRAHRPFCLIPRKQ